jgi:hypothetical protein
LGVLAPTPTAMNAVLVALAALLGAALPLAALALLARWRLARARIRWESQQLSTPDVIEVAEPEPAGLAWLRDTIGTPALGTWPERGGPRRCRRCGYQEAEPSFFCRRCGSRIGIPKLD